MLATQTITYQADTTSLIGYYAYEENSALQKRPAVLICHDWSGVNDFVRNKAHEIAALGYVGFALDMYGHGQTGNTKEEKVALMQPVMAQRTTTLLTRIRAALNSVKTLPQVDPHRIAAIGFCFGGLCVLDLARSGADLKGVISFHGLLNASTTPSSEIKAKILALTGFDDPMVDHHAVMTFAQEMTAAHANWEIDIYGNTMHAFTNPKANDPAFGTVHQPQAAARAARAMKTFLEEVL